MPSLDNNLPVLKISCLIRLYTIRSRGYVLLSDNYYKGNLTSGYDNWSYSTETMKIIESVKTLVLFLKVLLLLIVATCSGFPRDTGNFRSGKRCFPRLNLPV